jgi:tetratricopeptide (TPR) repeat protein
VATLLAVVTEEIEPIKTVAPTVPRPLALIIERALSKSREDRWPNMEAMLVALEALGPMGEEVDPHSRERGGTIAPGEQRIVAVLMARGIFDRDLLKKEIEARDGVVVPIIGGQAVGLFGVKQWRGDEIERAVEAGLAVRAVVERIAVASGRVAQTGAKVSGGVVRAAEACCDAEIDGLALDASAAQAVAHLFVLTEVLPGVFSAGARKPRALFTTQLEKLETAAPLFGRDAELARITRAMRSVIEERQPRTVLLIGPVGIGKRRLGQEAMRRLDEKTAAGTPAKLLHARCEAQQTASAFSAFRRVLEERAELGASLWGWPRLGAEAPLGERQHAVMRLVDEAIGDRRQAALAAGFIGRLVGVEMPETADLAAARADPQLMQDRLRLALLEYLLGLAGEAPVGLFLEEIQWMDPDSLAVLEQLEARPLFTVLTARPEIDRTTIDFLDAREPLELELEGLERLDVADMAKWIASRALPDALIDALAERTGGNPLFVEQIVSALVAEARLDAEPKNLPLPLTVEAAVQSRLDQLSFGEKAACRRCSVLHRPFFHHEATALGVDDAAELLKRLTEKRILAMKKKRHTSLGAEFRFKSTLIQDVAYRMIVEEQRAPLHAKAAAHLSRLPDTDPEELAFHYERAGDPKRAALHHARAAFNAARRGDSRKVDACTERSLALGTPEEALFDLAMIRGEALQFLGRHEERDEAIAIALEAARNASERAQALAEKVKDDLRAGRPEQAITSAEEAVKRAQEVRDSDVLVLALGRYGLALTKAGRLADARRALEEADRVATLAPIHLRALIAGWKAQLAGNRGDLAGRLHGFSQAVQLYQRAGDSRRVAGAKVNVADVYNRVGDYHRAEKALEEAQLESRRVHNLPMEGYALVNRAYSLTSLGRTEEALRLLGEASRIADRIGDQQLELYARLYWVRAHTGSAEARLAEEAESIARTAEKRFPSLAINAFSRAAMLRYRMSEHDKALALSAKAMEVLDRVGASEEDEVEVYLTHSRLLEKAGRVQEAEDVLRRGRRRLNEMAGAIEDVALRDQLLHGVAAHRTLLALSATL